MRVELNDEQAQFVRDAVMARANEVFTEDEGELLRPEVIRLARILSHADSIEVTGSSAHFTGLVEV
jgi:hypothetical protein